MPEKFDLVILGSGSTAFAAALAAQELGKTAVMTEERVIGGTCVNRGCLPSKNLIEAAKLLHDARNPRYPGLTPGPMDVDFAALVSQKDEVVHGYRKKKYESLVGGHIGIEKGHVQFLDPHTVEVGGKRLSGEKVLIATGSHPVLPAIEGAQEDFGAAVFYKAAGFSCTGALQENSTFAREAPIFRAFSCKAADPTSLKRKRRILSKPSLAFQACRAVNGDYFLKLIDAAGGWP